MTGACAACGTPLADDQLHCLGCGLRCAPDELRLAALAATASAPQLTGPVVVGARRPVVRSAAITAVVVLCGGVAVGATIGPATVGETAAAQRPLLLVDGPAGAATATPSTPVALAPPSADLVVGGGVDASPLAPSDAPTPVVTPPASPARSTPETPQPPPAVESPPADSPGDQPPPEEPARDAAPPGSVQLAGVVVQADPTGERFAVAGRHGRLVAIHAAGCTVAVGDDLHLRARRLANGTWAADHVRRVRTAVTTVTTVGVVSQVDPAAGRYALSARGVTLTIAAVAAAAAADADPAGSPAPAVAPPAATTTPAASTPPAGSTTPAPPAATDPIPAATVPPTDPAAQPAPALPAIGDRVRVRLALALSPPAGSDPAPPPVLTERARTILRPPAGTDRPFELEGAIETVDPTARTVVLALDGADPPAATVTIRIPARFQLQRLLPAERVAATVRQTPDGAYELGGIAADDDATAGDDPSLAQGELAPQDPPSATASPIAVTGCTVLG